MDQPLIIFDCDGTLVDSEVLANQLWVDIAAEYGVLLSLDEVMQRFKGGTMAECIAELEGRIGRSLPKDLAPEIRRRRIERLKTSVKPIPGAIDLVRAVAGAKCVASNGPRAELELSLSLTGLLPYFGEQIFSAYEVGTWKPDPGLFLYAARTMGFAPEACIVVEDSIPGIRAGLAAGMKVFAFQPNGREAGLPEDAVVVGSLSKLQSLLAGPAVRAHAGAGLDHRSQS